LAGLSFQASGVSPALVADFSPPVLRCRGAATSVASMICQPGILDGPVERVEQLVQDLCRNQGFTEVCPFRKFHPAWIRIVRQNHRILISDVCDPAFARNIHCRPVQVAQST
jgi:hypothetical protein